MGYHLNTPDCEAGCTSKTAYPRFTEYEAGFRFFTTSQGRWVNRDPISERGGMNVYVFGANRMGNIVDALGLSSCCRCFGTTINSSGDIARQFSFGNWQLEAWVGLKVNTSSIVDGDASKCKYEWIESGAITLRDPNGIFEWSPTEPGPKSIPNPYEDDPGHWIVDEPKFKWHPGDSGQYTMSINLTFTARCTGTDGKSTSATTSVLETKTYVVDVLGNATLF